MRVNCHFSFSNMVLMMNDCLCHVCNHAGDMCNEVGFSMSSVELATSFTWDVSHVIGYEAESIEGRELVCKAWCKLCSKHTDKVRCDG